MNLKPPEETINFIVFTDNNDLFNWVDANLKLSPLLLNKVVHCHIRKVNEELLSSSYKQVLIVDEVLYPKLLTKLKNTFVYSQSKLSILVLTNSQNTRTYKNLDLATVDFVPWESVTVFLFSHLINSLIRDSEQNQSLHNLAHFDPLTKVANRRLFEDRGNQIIKRAKRYKEPLSLLYFDLDDFKKVNDTLGHEIGDLLLIKFVELVQKNCRETDTLARWGGDEFVLLLPKTSHEFLQKVVEKNVELLSKEYLLKGHQILIKSSIGAVSADEENYANLSLSSFIKSADIAVYEAKKIKGTSVHYSIHSDSEGSHEIKSHNSPIQLANEFWPLLV